MKKIEIEESKKMEDDPLYMAVMAAAAPREGGGWHALSLPLLLPLPLAQALVLVLPQLQLQQMIMMTMMPKTF